MCNIGRPPTEKIEGMTIHTQMQRLYQAALQTHGAKTQAEIAKLLNSSSQTINNWEARGISAAGMIKAEEVFGCSASWLESGNGEPFPYAKSPAQTHLVRESGAEYRTEPPLNETAQFIIDLLNKTDARGQLKIKLACEDAYLQHQSIGRSPSEKAAIAATKEEEILLSIYREVPDYFKSIVLTAAHNVKNSANPTQPRPTTETDKKSG